MWLEIGELCTNTELRHYSVSIETKELQAKYNALCCSISCVLRPTSPARLHQLHKDLTFTIKSGNTYTKT